MFVVDPMLHLEPELGQDFQPSCHLVVGLLPSTQSDQRGMISLQDKLFPIEVGPEEDYGFDGCQ